MAQDAVRACPLCFLVVVAVLLACGGAWTGPDGADVQAVDAPLDPAAPLLGYCVDEGRCGLARLDGASVLAPVLDAPTRVDGGLGLGRKGGEVVLIAVSEQAVKLVETGARAATLAAPDRVLIWPDGVNGGAVLVDRDGAPVGGTRWWPERTAPGPRAFSSSQGFPASGLGEEVFFDDLLPGCDGPRANRSRMCGYLRRDGVVSELERGQAFVDGLAVTWVEGGQAYRGLDGAIAIPGPFGSAAPFSEGFAWVQIGAEETIKGDLLGGWSVIDRTGRVLSAPGAGIDDQPFPFSEGRAVIWDVAADRPGLIAPSGERCLAPEGTTRVDSLFDGRALFAVGDAVGWLATDCSVAIPADYPAPTTWAETSAMRFTQERAAARGPSGAWGYLAPDGSWAIPAVFARAGAFEGGYASVEVLGSMRWIDRAGRDVGRPSASRP